jgi:hypothetical protein
MELSLAQTEQLLLALGDAATLSAFQALAAPALIADWSAHQWEPRDTETLALRRAHIDFLEALLARLGWGPLVRVTDFYYFTDAPKPANWRGHGELPAGLTTPVVAYKVLETVFNFDVATATWTTRPWLGVSSDPLLHLPYSRKYDRERAQYAERAQTRDWERLSRAFDLIDLVFERVSRIPIDRALESEPFVLPNLDDIQDELNEDGLALGIGGLGFDTSQIEFELLRLSEQRDPDGRRRPSYPALVSGVYAGPLLEVQGKSEATKKQILLHAFSALRDAIGELTYPLDYETALELDEEKGRLRAFFADAKHSPRSRPSALAE